jgi:hypothetical protein
MVTELSELTTASMMAGGTANESTVLKNPKAKKNKSTDRCKKGLFKVFCMETPDLNITY